jgi:hypothetical protein
MVQPYTPWRLYRGVVPPIHDSDRSIAFTGFRRNITNTIRVELTALWIYAYMRHCPTLSLPDTEERQYPAAREAKRVAVRSPWGDGRFFPDDYFDQNALFDQFVGDLVVKVWRLGRS